MKYSEIKARIKILRKHSFVKRPKFGFYERTYSYNGWYLKQTLSNYDLYYSKRMDNLDDYLKYLYKKNMKTLKEYDIQDY